MINHGVMHTVCPALRVFRGDKTAEKGDKNVRSSRGVYKNRGKDFAVGRKETKVA